MGTEFQGKWEIKITQDVLMTCEEDFSMLVKMK